MRLEQRKNKYLSDDEALVKYEPLIYYHIHKMNLWRQFPSYREDMVQEGRMAVLRAIKAYKDEPNLIAYIHSTVRNAIYDYTFKDMKLQQYSKNVEFVEGYSGTEAPPLEETLDLMRMIEGDKHRDILGDYFYGGFTQAEVADKYNVSQQWVSIIINRFRERAIEEWSK